jgi:hypothetical protein
VQWYPVHLYFRTIKKKEINDLSIKCANLGITFGSAQGGLLPDASHTHYVIPKLQKEGTLPQLVAAGHQLSMVSMTWAESLFEAATIAPGAKRCKLEEDFSRSWPDEMESFPPVDGKNDNQLEREIWKPIPARRKLFDECVFVDFSGARPAFPA